MCGLLSFAVMAAVLAMCVCTGAPTAAIAFSSAAAQPELVAAAMVPAFCPASPAFRTLPWTHPMYLLLFVGLLTWYLVSLQEAGVGSVLHDAFRFCLVTVKQAWPMAAGLFRVIQKVWKIFCACLTGILFIFMVHYFAEGADAASVAGAPSLTHDSAMRIQGTLDWVTEHGFIDSASRFDVIQMVARRTNVTMANLDLLDRESALSISASLGIEPSVVPVCPAAPDAGVEGGFSPVGKLTSSLTLLDSGSGVHAINSTKYVQPGSVVVNTMGISTANGIVVPPTKCTARIPMRTKSGKRILLWLTDCLILTNSEYTLVSVGRLANEMQLSTTYGPQGSYISYPDGTVVPLASVDNVLVLPDVNASALPGCSSPVVHGKEGSQDISWLTLHRRFNDRSWNVLKNITGCAYNPPLAWKRTLQGRPKVHCDDCLQAKADLTPSTGHAPPVDRPGSISYDVWTASVGHVHGGQTKVIGFHDQYSDVTKYYLLHSEQIDDVQGAMLKYLAWAKSYNVTPWRFHTDNAPQLSGPTMKAWLAEKGIHCTTCAPHEPKQNSIIENRWRVAANDIRTAIARQIPPSYWWYVMSAQQQVAWCIPRPHPTAPSTWTTSWQLWTGHRPDVRQHRVIGCLAYYKVRGPQGKFDMRARRALHLGRAEDQPAYVLLDLESRTIVVSPHVRFVEGIMPGLSKYAQAGEPEGDDLFKLDSPSADGELVTGQESSDPPGDSVQQSAESSELHSESGDAPVIHPGAQPPPPPEPRAEDSDDDDLPAAPDAPAAVPLSLQRSGRDRVRPDLQGQRLTYDGAGRQAAGGRRGGAACSALLAGIAALGVPQTGGYLLYLGSGSVRDEGFSAQVAQLQGPHTVPIDVCVGGYAHDMSHPDVAQAVIAAASDPRCAGVLASPPCKTWSASRGVAAGGGLAFSQPLRDIDHPLGFKKEDGSLPGKVDIANRIADCAAAACQAVYYNSNPSAGFILEAPVARGAHSQFAIPGRESHIGVLDHPSVKALYTSTNSSVVNFDQCCTRDNPTETR